MDNFQQRFSTGFFSASQPTPSADDTPTKAEDAIADVDGDDINRGDVDRYTVDPSAADASSSDENIAPDASADLDPAVNMDAGSDVDTAPRATDEFTVPQSSPVVPPSANSTSSARPSLPRFSAESAPESSAPPQNWSLSSGFWQATERSPTLKDMSPQESQVQESHAQEAQAQ
ncbi:MAG: hypothetical protein ACFCBU_14785 [Cyanophyceae cyanobacterium]